MAAPDALPDPAESRLVGELTEAVLAESLPAELAVFRARADRYVAQRGTVPAADADDMLGFGAEAIPLLTPFIVAATTTVVRWLAQAVVDGAAGAVSDTIKDTTKPHLLAALRRLLGLGPVPVPEGPAADPAPPASASTGPAPSAPAASPVVISAELARAIRNAVLDTVAGLGLDDIDAAFVADAVTGRIITSAR